MPWNSLAPVGSISVKANRTVLQQNTTYIETTMGNDIVGTNNASTRDHFWDVGANEDGRHRFIQSVGFTVGTDPADPVLGTGMDTVLYPKTTNGRVEWFHRNAEGIYQFIPSLKEGTVNLTSAYINIDSVPANVYGIIYIWRVGTQNIQSGTFLSGGALAESYSNRIKIQGLGADTDRWVELGNGTNAAGLNIRGRKDQDINGTYNYKILYWAL